MKHYVLKGHVRYEGDVILGYYQGKPSVNQLKKQLEGSHPSPEELEQLAATGELEKNDEYITLEEISFIEGKADHEMLDMSQGNCSDPIG